MISETDVKTMSPSVIIFMVLLHETFVPIVVKVMESDLKWCIFTKVRNIIVVIITR